MGQKKTGWWEIYEPFESEWVKILKDIIPGIWNEGEVSVQVSSLRVCEN